MEDGRAPSPRTGATLRIAAAGDIHCRESHPEATLAAFARLPADVDLVLLAGDLTNTGHPGEAAVLAEAARTVSVPIVVVLGNHDWHCGHQEEIEAILHEAGVRVLDGEATICEVRGHEVGVVGVKGFVGGFAPGHLPDFGEPSLRGIYAETGRDVDALDRGLREIATCPFRVVLLHYSPCEETLRGEAREIFVFLGTDRLAAPIREHGPDLVLHGHAHAGTLEGRIGAVPVYNVSVPVIGRDFWTVELTSERAPVAPIH